MPVYELPYPPSVNKMYVRGKNGRTYKSRGAKAFMENAWAAVLAQGRERIEGRLEVRIALFPPELKRKRDLDNTIKCTLDLLMAAQVFDDDEAIDKLTIERNPASGNGKVVVFIDPRTLDV